MITDDPESDVLWHLPAGTASPRAQAICFSVSPHTARGGEGRGLCCPVTARVLEMQYVAMVGAALQSACACVSSLHFWVIRLAKFFSVCCQNLPPQSFPLECVPSVSRLPMAFSSTVSLGFFHILSYSVSHYGSLSIVLSTFWTLIVP